MNLGVGAKCRRVEDSDALAIYEYSIFYLDSLEHNYATDIFDGIIKIVKSELEEPIIKEKTIKTSSGKEKTVIKRVHKDIDIKELIKKNYIVISNSSHCLETSDIGVDVMAIKLCNKIFEIYQDESFLPETVSIFS